MDMFKKASAAASKVAGQVKKDVIEDKNIWKTLGYATIGIGTVAALPVMGAVGAVSVTGAVVGAAGGIAAQKVLNHKERTKKPLQQQAENAELIMKNDEIESYINACKKQLNPDDYAQLLVAALAVAIATANADEKVTEEEQKAIAHLFKAVQNSQVPEHIRKNILQYKNNPPSLKDAFEQVQKVPNYSKDFFSNIIFVVANCDGEFSDCEKNFISAWKLWNK